MTALFSNGINLIIFLVMLGVLVFVHELGHFVVAKRLGIPVLEFGFGFPPRLVRLMKRDETEYTVNAIPMGGFVRLMGEEDPTVPGGFAAAKPSIRAPILLAGVTMNLILAFVVFAITAFTTPPYVSVETTRIVEVIENSPAALVGLRDGDTIAAVNGQDIKNNYPAFRQLVRQNAGSEITLAVIRNNRPLDPIRVVPRVNPPSGEGPLGIALMVWVGIRVTSVAPGSVADRAGVRAGDVLVFLVDPQGRPLKDQSELVQFATTHPGWKIEWYIARNSTLLDPIVVQIPDPLDLKDATLGVNLQTSLLDSPVRAVQEMWNAVALIPELLGQVLEGSAPSNAFVGPVGMYQVTGEVAQRGGLLALLELLGLLSLNLAVVNLLPFPALDGGRLVFVVLEWIRGGKKIDPQKEGLVHLVGIAVLLGLMLIISYFDVLRLISGQPIFQAP